MIEGFIQAMAKEGIITTHRIIPDGDLHRFCIQGDKKRSKNGWYVFYPNKISFGVFGNWKHGSTYRWTEKPEEKLNFKDRLVLEKQIQEAVKQREYETKIKQEEARYKAHEIWSYSRGGLNAHLSLCNPYLYDKKVKSYNLKETDNRKLIIPIYDITGELRSLQFIGVNGEKHFLTGGRIKGCFFQIGKIDKVVCICEGYATGASIHEYAGYPVVVAFNAGNLKSVAVEIRKKYPTVKIILCADNDASNERNTGVEKAHEAARTVNGIIAIPPCDGDFNDWYNGYKK